MRKEHLYVKYAFMRFFKAIYIIKKTHKTIPQQCPNYNEDMTVALSRVLLCNEELASHTTKETKHSQEITLATHIILTFIIPIILSELHAS